MKIVCTFMCGVAVLLLVTASTAIADEPPPFAPDPISLDRASPSVVLPLPLGGNTTADIYGEIPFGPLGGWDIGGPGPVLHVKDAVYGMGPLDNNDGHSNGEQNPQLPIVLYFSGDDLSMGAPGTHYNHQAIRGQAAGDRFVVNGPAINPPAVQMMPGAPPNGIAGPVLPGPINLLSANQHRYNEIPSIMPPAFNAYVPPAGATIMDDMDALELTPFDLNMDGIHETPIFFSLDPASPWLMPMGGSGADILVAPPVGPVMAAPFAVAPQLGLVPADDVDALAVWDMDGNLAATPGIDFALFSLAPGSPRLAGGLFSAADIFVTDFTGINALYLTAPMIGMLPSDNVDALDVEFFFGPGAIEVWDRVPEPSTIMLLAIAGVLLAGGVRSRRR